MTEQKVRKGSCLCGKISIKVEGEMRGVSACHCGQCRKQTGSYYMATSAPDDAITISGEEYLKWYHASDDAKRGFCAECGSALFWKHEHETATSIMAGCFDAPTDLKVVKHIFMADKGDYYDISDGVEQFDDGGR